MPKDGPESYHLKFHFPRGDGSPALVTPEVYIGWEI